MEKQGVSFMRDESALGVDEVFDDFVLPFQLDSCPVRGRLVRLGPTLDMIVQQHAYPHAIAHLLGQGVVVASALANSLKYDGVFTFQVKSDGVVRVLIADVTNAGGVRAYAQYKREDLEALNGAKEILGKGHLAFTVDNKLNADRYQGVVELTGTDLATAVQHYFLQSEQIPTALVVAVRCDDLGRWRGGCLMVQKMPLEGGIITQSLQDTSKEDDWHRIMLLMNTCTEAELCDAGLTADRLLYRLFHEEGVRVHGAHMLRHQCRCSKERVDHMLRSLPKDEIEALAVDGHVRVTCEFCNKTYAYSQQERHNLYTVDAVKA